MPIFDDEIPVFNVWQEKEFKRVCRREVQERLDRMTSVHSIPDETGGINRTEQPMWRSKL